MPEMMRPREAARLSPARGGLFTVALAVAVIAAILLLRSPADGQEQRPCTIAPGTMQEYFCAALLHRKQVRIDGTEFRLAAVHDDHFVLSSPRRAGAGGSISIPTPIPYTAVRAVEVWGGTLVVSR